LGLLTINALTAADRVIMPLECEFFALRGIALLTDTIAKVQDRLNPKLETLGILGTMYDPRTLHSREVLERVVEAFGEQVFHTVIRRTVKFPETTVAGEPITTYAPTSPGAEAHRSLAREALARCRVTSAWAWLRPRAPRSRSPAEGRAESVTRRRSASTSALRNCWRSSRRD